VFEGVFTWRGIVISFGSCTKLRSKLINAKLLKEFVELNCS
jgi:hypothetical protein